VFFVSEQPENPKAAEFDWASGDLTRSLKLCHSLVEDYRVKLAGAPNLQAANDIGEDPDIG
jgi:hypothetical protein